ncbi:MAG: hypothetical protein GY703_00065 [Gammaproteobacteria bacterium]|nr:hypothetical protein [Gammaproteobacteria bacterium]
MVDRKEYFSKVHHYDCPRLKGAVEFKVAYVRVHTRGDFPENFQIIDHPSPKKCSKALKCGVATKKKHSVSWDWSDCEYAKMLKVH